MACLVRSSTVERLSLMAYKRRPGRPGLLLVVACSVKRFNNLPGGSFSAIETPSVGWPGGLTDRPVPF